MLVHHTKILNGEKGCLSTSDAGTNTVNRGCDDWMIHRNYNLEEPQQLSNERNIRRQLRLFAKERNPNLEFDDEMERRHDALIMRPKLNEGSEVGDLDDIIAELNVVPEKEPVQADNERSSIKSVGRDILTENVASDDGQDLVVEGTKKITHALLVQPLVKKARIQQGEHNNSGTAAANQKPTTVVVKTPIDALPAQPFPLPPRKCYECKNLCTVYRSCHYWSWTTKCIKKYCIPCLSSKYTLGNDVISDTNPNGIHRPEDIGTSTDFDREWHCPSCVAQRESEEERERIRKSSRKSAMGNNYAGFFQK